MPQGPGPYQPPIPIRIPPNQQVLPTSSEGVLSYSVKILMVVLSSFLIFCFQHPSYPPPPPPPPPPVRSRVPDVDEDENLWRQRRRQQSDEVSQAVERARQKREEGEKRFEQTKAAATVDKLKSLDEKNNVKSAEEIENKENLAKEEKDRSRTSSESREDKPPSRDGARERDYERDREAYRPQSYQVIHLSVNCIMTLLLLMFHTNKSLGWHVCFIFKAIPPKTTTKISETGAY